MENWSRPEDMVREGCYSWNRGWGIFEINEKTRMASQNES